MQRAEKQTERPTCRHTGKQTQTDGEAGADGDMDMDRQVDVVRRNIGHLPPFPRSSDPPPDIALMAWGG